MISQRPLRKRGCGTDAKKDTAVVSPHEFAGGPLSFVFPWDHDCTQGLGAWDEAGTPNAIGGIRAGPYGHRLPGIDQMRSDHLRREPLAGNGMKKPGWVRLNFSYLMNDETVDYIINSVNELSHATEELCPKAQSEQT